MASRTRVPLTHATADPPSAADCMTGEGHAKPSWRDIKAWIRWVTSNHIGPLIPEDRRHWEREAVAGIIEIARRGEQDGPIRKSPALARRETICFVPARQRRRVDGQPGDWNSCRMFRPPALCGRYGRCGLVRHVRRCAAA